MSRREVIECDRCGAEDADEMRWPVHDKRLGTWEIGGNIGFGEERAIAWRALDLCQECRLSFDRWWDRGAVESGDE